MTFNHDNYLSPFTWRYGSQKMRQTWSEIYRRLLMRRVWVALATAQHSAGLVTFDQLADLQAHSEEIDISQAAEIEAETKHDMMAEIKLFAEQCPVGGRIIHWGATSADITDNVDVLRIRESFILIKERLVSLLKLYVNLIIGTSDIVVMAYTHIQPAEPTSLGYRFAVYAQDLLEDLISLNTLVAGLKGKGFKGAVGSQASFEQILRDTHMSPAEMESRAMAYLGLPYFPIATQTYTRQQDLRVLNVLSGIASSLHKFALDFRLLQSPLFSELQEPFAAKQTGSSAMPFKRNPVNLENICSLARFVSGLPAVAWDNASQAVLERSLDDSANRRIIFAEAFLAIDEMLIRSNQVLSGMEIDRQNIKKNLEKFGPFASTERLLMALVAQGANRQEAHDWIREASQKAWVLRHEGGTNPLPGLLAADERIRSYFDEQEVIDLLNANQYVGTAPERAREFAQSLLDQLQEGEYRIEKG